MSYLQYAVIITHIYQPFLKSIHIWPKQEGFYYIIWNFLSAILEFLVFLIAKCPLNLDKFTSKKNWSAENCPLNWSCPLFLESAKLEFHCITLLFCGSVIPRRRKKRGCFIFCERWKSLAFSSRSFMRKPDFVITNTGPLIVWIHLHYLM